MTLRVGVLGTGPWARKTHAPALAAHTGVELAGVWGRRPQAAEELAARFGGRAYADADELIADVDAVAIALPPQIQAELAVRAARAGRHLLLDKPVAATVPAARAVADAVRRRGDVGRLLHAALRPGPAGWIERQAAAGDWFTGRADWYGRCSATTAPARTRTRRGAGRRAGCGTWARTRCRCCCRCWAT